MTERTSHNGLDDTLSSRRRHSCRSEVCGLQAGDRVSVHQRDKRREGGRWRRPYAPRLRALVVFANASGAPSSLCALPGSKPAPADDLRLRQRVERSRAIVF